MKKVLFVVILIAVLIYAVSALNPGRNSLERFEPTLAGVETVMAVNPDDGSVYLVDYDGSQTYIYRVNENGKITALYKDAIPGSIAAMTVHKGMLYCVVDRFIEKMPDGSTWYLLEIPLNLEFNSARKIYAGDYSVLHRITDISTSGLGLSVAGVSDNGLSAHTLKWSQIPERAPLDEFGGFETLPEPVRDASASANEENIIVSAMVDGGNIKTVLKSGAGIPEKTALSFDELKLPLNVRISMFRFPSFRFVVWELLLTSALIASSAVLMFSKKIANRTTAGFAFSLLVMFAVLAEVQGINTSAALSAGREDEARGKSVYISGTLDGYDYTVFNDADFYRTAEFSELSSYFGSYYDNRGNTVTQSRSELIFITERNRPVTAVSERFPYKQSAEDVFSSSVMEAVEAALDTGSTVTALSGKYTVSVSPCFYGGRVIALVVTEVSKGDVDYALSKARSDYMKAGLTVILVAVLVMFLFNQGLTRPLNRVIKRMGKYGDGRFETGDFASKVSSKGDVGEMERAISEIGVSLAINEYETKTMINSFYRFVPRGIEKLLHRAGITEISSGDIVSVKDNLCLLSVDNRERVQESTDDNGYMSFVNRCFSVIHENVQKHEGMLLSGDFNLSSLPILFSGESGSHSGGLRFGLDVMAGCTSDGETAPDFFMFLHHTKFLYGIAGTEEKAFPFLSSYEMNFLNSYSHKLRTLGVRIVMTEQYYNYLSREANFSARFIGFISSQDENYSYKLYEALDCYPDSEKLERKRYNDRFQKAITMFLKNDFYLARSEFSAILRSNPSDGVARWYIFACEHLFNSNDLSKATYNLFGIEE
ncbi:MAG: hypothetical protein FWD34_01105 [Oscillospiraceae bacterium]|nr:hypothetical protein [Oscillospiraceae bacterium]